MPKLILALLASLAIAAMSAPLMAQAKKCPEGKVYNPDTGKCVTPRGSY